MTFEGPKGGYTVRPEDHVLLQPLPLVKLTNLTDPDFKFVELITARGRPGDRSAVCRAGGTGPLQEVELHPA